MDDREMENMEPDLVIFEDEDGNEITLEVLDYVFYNGEEYALLTEADEEIPEDGEIGCYICKVTQDPEDEENEIFESVEDEELGDKLMEIFNTRMNEDEEEGE